MSDRELVIEPTLVPARWIFVILVAPMLVPAVAVRTAGAFALGTAVLAAFVGVCVALRRRKLVVDDDGITLHGWLGRDLLAWSSVTRYRYDNVMLLLARLAERAVPIAALDVVCLPASLAVTRLGGRRS